MADDATAAQRLERLIEHYVAAPQAVRAQALADYADRLRDPPHSEGLMQLIPECGVPVAVGLQRSGDAVRLFIEAPLEPGMLRGFAGIVSDALDGASIDEIAGFSAEVVEPLIETVDPPVSDCIRAVLAHLTERVSTLD